MKLRLALLALLLAAQGPAYIREQVSGTTTPLVRVDNTGIQFDLNQQIAPGYRSSASGSAVTVITSGSNPQQAVHLALQTWNSVSTANIHFLPLVLTPAVIDSTDYQNTIAFGSTASDLSAVGSALAITINSYVTGPANPGTSGSDPVGCTSNCQYPAAGDIFDSDIILNPEYSFSTTGDPNTHDLQAVILHELGHSLSANHTGILAASMFQFPFQHFLTTDDLAFVNSAYPPQSGAAPLGMISGTVTVSGGGAVPFALLTAFDTTENITVGGLTNSDGTYSFSVPPGNYQIYAEPLNGVVPINVYLSAEHPGLAAGGNFQTTLYSGTLTVTANSNVTANITVTPGTSVLAAPAVAVTQVNAPVTSPAIGGPVTIPSGQSVDLVLSGPGFDGSLAASNFTFYSSSLSIKSGSVRVDSSQMINGSPLLRITLNVSTVTTPTLASFIVTSGASTLSFSGALLIVPPTPSFLAAGVVSSAAYKGIPGEVVPGGLYTIYDIPNIPNLGPPQGINNSGYDEYGFLPTTLAGVTVTFNGVPAPMFYASAGQLNLQVPFEVAGTMSAQVVVSYLGSPSSAVTVPVVPSQPLFFQSCNGLCAVNLPSGTLNSAQNPAPRGSYVEIYGTGVGKVSYTIITGEASPGLPSGFNGNYTYSIGGSPAAPANFGGYTPTEIGLDQWDLRVPMTVGTGAQSVQVQDASGANNLPQDAVIYVQ